ncbi:hypothetical protein K9K77_00320 [Candidatus Babeliales bacterium]|nr:hypothetical protein [Candidatus Babeliales bacterium]
MVTFLLFIVCFSSVAQQNPYFLEIPIPYPLRPSIKKDTSSFEGDILKLSISAEDTVRVTVLASAAPDKCSNEIPLENIFVGAALFEQEELLLKTKEEIINERIKGKKEKNRIQRTYCALPLSEVMGMISELNKGKSGNLNYLGRTLTFSKVKFNGAKGLFLSPSYLPSKSLYAQNDMPLKIHFDELLKFLQKRFFSVNTAGRIFLKWQGTSIVKKQDSLFLLGKEDDDPVGIFVQQ